MRWKVARKLKFFLDLLTVSVSWFLSGVSSFFAAYLRRIYDRKSSLCSLNLGPVKSRRLTAAAVRLLSHITDIQWHKSGYAGMALLQFKLYFSLDPRGRESSQSSLDKKIFSFHLLTLTKPHRPLSTSVFVRNHSPVHRSEAFIQPWEPFSKLLLCFWTQRTNSQSFQRANTAWPKPEEEKQISDIQQIAFLQASLYMMRPCFLFSCFALM